MKCSKIKTFYVQKKVKLTLEQRRLRRFQLKVES